MGTKNKPEVKKPENLDWKVGMDIAKKVIQENQEWLKEMAQK